MTTTTASRSALQTLVLPDDHNADALPLYVDAAPSSFEVAGRRSLRVTVGESASLATYFNAFPAAYWHRWTTVRSVTLSVPTSGSGTITVMRSDADGNGTQVDRREVSGESHTTFDLPLTGFDDGGWYWFDAHATGDLTLHDATWAIDAEPTRRGLMSLAITTFNKPDYCVRTLQSLAADPELLAEIDRVFIIDQGTQHVADEPGFSEASAALGDTLQIITQSNLGGSGGFSRGMAEALKRDTSDFVMLLDDDVEIETDGMLRALHFARHCVSPTIVGGHMLDLGERSVLHAFSEIVDPKPFMWGPPDRAHERHDFKATPLRDAAWMHRREDSDFNGWWMCLIPTSIIREIGLALPVFIKWDDAEYGLRAKAAGYPTVSFPGAALWHISWVDKDDTLDWQAYFHARNRLIAALLHSDEPGGGSLLGEYRKQDLKHLLSMQYYPVTLRHQALRDVLAGPGKLHEVMPTQLAKVRTEAEAFPEMQVYRTGDGSTPPPSSNQGKRVYPPTDGKGPRGRALMLFTAKAALRHWFTRPAPANVKRPQLELSKRDATWWRLPGFDSALVGTGDGTGASWYTRDRAQFRRLLLESLLLHRQVAREWDRLRDEYRSAAPQFTSVAEWENTFER